MVLFVDGKKADKIPEIIENKSPENAAKNTEIILFASFKEAKQALHLMGLDDCELPESVHQATRFESRHEMDYTYIDQPNLKDILGQHRKATVILTKTGFLILSDGLVAAEKLEKELSAWPEEFPGPDRALELLIARMTSGDADILADIEEEVAALEERIIDKKEGDYTAMISQLRKRLMVLHRYYEGLFEALEDMEENLNGLISKGVLKGLRLQKDRSDRYTRAVENLRDYVTQVREAYQHQLDISLNETMKLFTVITAIFLPLSLIAGWFGMNLKMPEPGFEGTYPIVIVVCLAVVFGCIWYFKRHKWF